MKTILIAAIALLGINLNAADGSKTAKWIDSITVAPVAVIQTEGIDGASTFGAGVDAGVGINKYASIHVAGYGYETDSWRGGVVDEVEAYGKANFASFYEQVLVLTGKGGVVWDTLLDDYAISVGAGCDLNFSKRFAVGADYSIRAWFNEREKDSLLRFFGQLKF